MFISNEEMNNWQKKAFKTYIIGASLSETHTRELVKNLCFFHSLFFVYCTCALNYPMVGMHKYYYFAVQELAVQSSVTARQGLGSEHSHTIKEGNTAHAGSLQRTCKEPAKQ